MTTTTKTQAECNHNWQRPFVLVQGREDDPGRWTAPNGAITTLDVCGACGMYQWTARRADGRVEVQHLPADKRSRSWAQTGLFCAHTFGGTISVKSKFDGSMHDVQPCAAECGCYRTNGAIYDDTLTAWAEVAR